MSKTVGEFFVERLEAWGIKTIFGYPGDGINGIMGTLGAADEVQQVADVPGAGVAKALLGKAEQVGAAWDEAFAARKPVVLEAHTDFEVPNNPPHVSFDQAMDFATSTPRDSAAVAIIKGAVSDLVEQFLPHRK